MFAHDLAQRDPALAALLGHDPADFGASFGGFGAAFGDFGDDAYTAMSPAAHAAPQVNAILANTRDPRHPLNPANQAAMIALWQEHMAEKHNRAQRMAIIDPNAGSDVKIMRFSFTASTALTLGTASAFPGTFSQNPQVPMRPQRVVMNVPSVQFAFISGILVANVGVLVGGAGDGFEYNANGVGAALDLPLIQPQNSVTVAGSYTGYVPPGFVFATAFTMTASFKGPATLTPQGGIGG